MYTDGLTVVLVASYTCKYTPFFLQDRQGTLVQNRRKCLHPSFYYVRYVLVKLKCDWLIRKRVSGGKLALVAFYAERVAELP